MTLCTPSQATAIDSIYLEVKHLFWTNSFARRECWDRAVELCLLTAFNAREDILCFKKWFALTATKQQSGMTCRICENTSFFSCKWQVWRISWRRGHRVRLLLGFYQRWCFKMRLSPTSTWQGPKKKKVWGCWPGVLSAINKQTAFILRENGKGNSCGRMELPIPDKQLGVFFFQLLPSFFSFFPQTTPVTLLL